MTDKGGRSGKRKRAAGGSDDEIARLSPDMKEKAKVTRIKDVWTDEEKEKVVSYILDPIRWPNFKVNQVRIFGEVHCLADRYRSMINVYSRLHSLLYVINLESRYGVLGRLCGINTRQ